MTGDLYKDVDVPFCCKCSRFMVTDIGDVRVVLNHESDPIYTIRVGRAYKCPECGHIVIYKWKDPYICPKEIFMFNMEYFKTWYIFLEDHKHYNKKRGWKGPQSKSLTVSSIKRSSLS